MDNKPPVENKPKTLTIQEAADYLRMAVGTLNNLRSRGEGPTYSRPKGMGIRYLVADLDAYVNQSRVRHLPLPRSVGT